MLFLEGGSAGGKRRGQGEPQLQVPLQLTLLSKLFVFLLYALLRLTCLLWWHPSPYGYPRMWVLLLLFFSCAQMDMLIQWIYLVFAISDGFA